MKIKSDSLYSRMGKELRDEFFGWYLAENPGYEEMLAWLDARGVAASNGSLWTLVNKHIATWKIDRAIESADEEVAALPADTDVRVKDRVRAIKFDLTLSDLTVQQKFDLLMCQQAEESNAIKRDSIAAKREALALMREKFDASERRIAAAREAVARLNESGGISPEARAEIEKAMGIM